MMLIRDIRGMMLMQRLLENQLRHLRVGYSLGVSCTLGLTSVFRLVWEGLEKNGPLYILLPLPSRIIFSSKVV